MNIELIEINKLKPATYNPRQISTKQYKDLKQSIEKFGLVDPIIINKDMTVIGGHQRLKICKELKHKQIDCVVLDLSKEEERELNIRLNKNTGEFDMDILANEFDIDELVDWGFKHIDLDINIDKITEGNTEDDHIPEVKESRVKLGDVWQLGKHRLMCGDSTKESDVEKLMNGDKADMVFTDPPYGINYQGLQGKTKKIKNDDKEISTFLDIIKYAKENSPLYFCCDFKSYPELFYSIKKYKREIKELIVWDKTEGKERVQVPRNSLMRWIRSTEFIAFSGNLKENCGYSANVIHYARIYGKNSIEEQDSYVKNYQNKISLLHPTIKPLHIIEKCIKAHKKEKKIIDLYLGSGSTLIACEKTNRICYGMELDTKYCDVIIERWEQFTGQKATKL